MLVTIVNNRGSILLETLRETVESGLRNRPLVAWEWGVFIFWLLDPFAKGRGKGGLMFRTRGFSHCSVEPYLCPTWQLAHRP